MNKVDLFISLGNICNLKCSYCNRHGGNDYISYEIFASMISQVSSDSTGRISYLSLWGGEPLLHPDFDEMVCLLISSFKNYENPITISINTNGLILQKKIDELERLVSTLPHISFKFYISIDGIGEGGNEFRGLNSGSYNIILDNILLLDTLSRKFENLKISTSTVLVLSDINISEFEKFVTFFTNKRISMGFCFQAYGGKELSIDKSIAKSLIERCRIIKKNGHKYVIESFKNVNKLLRCDEYGNVYNFIDKSFIDSNRFLISQNADLSFLGSTRWKQEVNENVVYAILYRHPDYIRLLKYLDDVQGLA